MPPIERLRWLAARVAAGGYRALPCWRCRRQTLVAAAAALEELYEARARLEASAAVRCPYCANGGCVCSHAWGDSCRCEASAC